MRNAMKLLTVLGGGGGDVIGDAIRAKLGGYWTFDEEADGDPVVTRLDSLGINDLTDVNGCISVAGVSSNTGNAARSSTAAGSLLRKLSPTGIVGNVNHEWFGWVRFISGTTNRMVGFIANQMRLRYDITGGNRFRYDIYAGTSTIRATASATTFGDPSLNTWYFICCGLMAGGDHGTAFISVNNGTMNTAVLSDAAGTNSNRLDFLNLAGANIVDGDTDEWGYVAGNLTADERTYLYNGGNGRALY